MTKEFRNTKDNSEEREFFLNTVPLGVLGCLPEEAESRSQSKAGRVGKRRQSEESIPGEGGHCGHRRGERCLYCTECLPLWQECKVKAGKLVKLM